MKYNPKIHHRQSMRLKNYDYSQAGLYFITIVTQNRECLFGEIINDEMVLNDAGEMIEKWYGELENKFSDINCREMVIMPNHIHFIVQNTGANVGADLRVCPNSPSDERMGEYIGERSGGHMDEHIGSPLHWVVQWFKTMSTNEYIRGVTNNGWRRFNGKLWQRNYWDHIIRNENEYQRIAKYIIDNPKKWALDKLNGGAGNQVMEQSPQYRMEAWMI